MGSREQSNYMQCFERHRVLERNLRATRANRNGMDAHFLKRHLSAKVVVLL